MTPNLEGFSVGLQAKHYSDRDLPEAAITETNETEVALQGALKYEIDNLRLALGVVDDVVEGDGNDELLYGATASYEFIPGFSGRLGYEYQSQNEDLAVSEQGGHETWGIGMSYAVNQWLFNLDYYNVDEKEQDSSRDSWSAAAYYNVSSNFQTFLELNDADADFDGADTSLNDVRDDVYWLVGARYFF